MVYGIEIYIIERRMTVTLMEELTAISTEFTKHLQINDEVFTNHLGGFKNAPKKAINNLIERSK